jgi:hypothetical protein
VTHFDFDSFVAVAVERPPEVTRHAYDRLIYSNGWNHRRL